jgi:hypothetical protein
MQTTSPAAAAGAVYVIYGKTSAATVVNIDLSTQPVTRLQQFGSKEIRTGKQSIMRTLALIVIVAVWALEAVAGPTEV